MSQRSTKRFRNERIRGTLDLIEVDLIEVPVVLGVKEAVFHQRFNIRIIQFDPDNSPPPGAFSPDRAASARMPFEAVDDRGW